MDRSNLNERAQSLLKVLIERYIKDGAPVGSRLLARDAGLDISPATVRNVMADLEEMGLVASPHTSAGRVPTALGYRLFVDSMLTLDPMDNGLFERLQGSLDSETAQTEVVKKASTILSNFTRMAGVVKIPRRDFVTIRQIEFLPLSHRQILVILVFNNGDVQNRIIQSTTDYSPAELVQAANYLNSALFGKGFQEVRKGLVAEMRKTRQVMDQMMRAAIEIAEKVFRADEEDGGDFVMEGQANLMGYEEMADMGRLRQLFEAFSQKQGILRLLDQAMTAEGVQIFIGEESGYQALDRCSVVTAPYTVNGQIVGVLGVIGPTRMAYEKVIPVVDVTAKLVGAALNKFE